MLLLLVTASFVHGQDGQVAAVRGLIGRVVPEHARFFVVSRLNASVESWEVETRNNLVHIRGTTGVAMASAFNWYLKYKCNSTFLWQEEAIALPSVLPEVSPKHSQNTSFPFRYYYNVCTMGYTTTFWSWDRWEREIDWMVRISFLFVVVVVDSCFCR
jgi:alpha-N-acetylglucosaminidase